MTPNDWLNLLLRWTHLIAGIYWIGSSFYFIWLDSHLTAPTPERENVEGHLWLVHSGGFYQVERRRIGPGQMPVTLHWFKWEAAITWITGILLLTVIYYLTHGIYLVDPAVSHIGPGAAAGFGLAMIVAAWVLYDSLWRSPLARKHAPVATALAFLLGAAAIYGFCRVLSGRAAYIHVGAMLGTLMVANVWLCILPAQQRMVDATQAGREPDYALGEQAKRRSVHNSYMTFPVLFIMLSNHFPGTYGNRLNWLILGLLILAGAGARHVMIGARRTRWWAAVPVAASLAVVALLTAPASSVRHASAAGIPGPVPRFAEVQAVVDSRCLACHSLMPRDKTFGAAPAGVTFDDPANIKRMAPRIYDRAVVTRTMPLGNKTGITEDERALLGRWIEHGAPMH